MNCVVGTHTHIRRQAKMSYSKNTSLNAIKRLNKTLVLGTGTQDLKRGAAEELLKEVMGLFEEFKVMHYRILDQFELKMPQTESEIAGRQVDVDCHEALYETVEGMVRSCRRVLRERIDELAAAEEQQKTGRQRTDGNADGQDAACHGMKLPPIQMKVFDGKDENWLEFRDMFESMVHVRKDCSSAYKLARLKEFVDQTKVTQVAGVYTGGYDQVWKEVKDRYDRPKRLAAAHVDLLLSLDDNPVLSRTGVRAVIDKFRSFRRAMTVMELPTDKWDGLLFPLLFRKLPEDAVAFYNQSVRGNGIPEVSNILEVVEEYAETLPLEEEANPIEESLRNRRPQRSNLTRTQGGHQGGKGCVLCGGAHTISKCSHFLAMAVEQRWTSAYNNGLCYNCLGSGHNSRRCTAGRCNCGGSHHLLLHNAPEQPRQPTPAAGTTPQVYPRT